MGFNAIHLLPIIKLGPSLSPYAAYDLFSIDQAYSETLDREQGFAVFQRFVDDCKKLKIALIIDLVFNNVGLSSLVVNEHREWIADDPLETDGIKRAGWSDGTTWHTWQDTALINYTPIQKKNRDQLWNTMIDYALAWAKPAFETRGGIRLDNLHSSNREFILAVLAEIRERCPSLFVMGELFGKEEDIFQLVREFRLDYILATPWEHKFVPELRAYIQYLHRESHPAHFFFPVNSHDSGVIAEEFGDARSTIPRLAVSALFGPGSWGITEGVEAKLKKKIPFIGEVKEEVISPDTQIVTMISQLNAMHATHEEFKQRGIQFLDEHHSAILLGLRRTSMESEKSFLVAANLDLEAGHACAANVPEPGINKWNLYHAWTNEKENRVFVSIKGNELRLTLPPASAAVIQLFQRKGP
jgi:hypothetical protein